MSADPYERFVPRPRAEDRSDIAHDRDRVIHSSALRRLQGKSQIVGVQRSDFFRTRLTHSLECAQIGRSIARRTSSAYAGDIVESPQDFEDLVEAACLAHDLGHPPFGHNGEQALQECMKDLNRSLFEGNAQSFRIVTFLEPKVFGETVLGADRSVGLNLTRVTLQAMCKYPWRETSGMLEEEHPKFGLYDTETDLEYFDWVWPDSDATKTVTAEIMDAADNIAYAVHDFEDGVWANMIPLHALVRADEEPLYEEAVLALEAKVRERDERRAQPIFDGVDIREDVEHLFETIQNEYWARYPFTRTKQSRADLKNFCSRLIGELIDSTISDDRFVEPEPAIQRRIEVLTGLAWVWMIERSDLTTRQFGQRKLLKDLFRGYCAKPEMLPHRDEWNEIVRARKQTGASTKDPWPDKLRFVCDHIAGMTDAYARRAHEEMYGGREVLEVHLTY